MSFIPSDQPLHWFVGKQDIPGYETSPTMP
jgi:hypothetical protein